MCVSLCKTERLTILSPLNIRRKRFVQNKLLLSESVEWTTAELVVNYCCPEKTMERLKNGALTDKVEVA